MTAQGESVIPREIAREIRRGMLQHIRAGALALAAELAPLASRDLAAFALAWREGVERITAEALAHARAEAARWTATREQWEWEQ